MSNHYVAKHLAGHANFYDTRQSESKSPEIVQAFKQRDILTLIFYFSLAAWLIWKILNTSMLAIPEGSKINTIVHFSLLGLFAVSCIKYIKLDANLLLAVIFGGVGVFIKLKSDNVFFIDMAVILYASYRHNFKDIAKTCLVVTFVTCAGIILLSQVGVIQDYAFSRGKEVRHGLGFLWTTYASLYYLNCVFLYIYLRKENITVYECLGIMAINLLLYFWTDSRNSLIFVTLALALTLFFKYVKHGEVFKKLVGYLSIGALVVFAVASFAAIFVYDSTSTQWLALNKITSNRLQQSQNFVKENGITPFGQDIEFSSIALQVGKNGIETLSKANPEGSKNYVDNGYLNLLLLDGVVMFVIVMAMIIICAINANKLQNYYLSFILLLYATASLVDHLLFYLLYNSFIFIYWAYDVDFLNEYFHHKILKSTNGKFSSHGSN